MSCVFFLRLLNTLDDEQAHLMYFLTHLSVFLIIGSGLCL
jgi:hypothetical protein